MAQHMQIPSRWRLSDEVRRGAHGPANASVVVPRIARSGLSPLLSGLVPDRDHNAGLARCLQDAPMGTAANQPVFALFAADPFLKVPRLARQFRARNYRRVINWPTVAQYGDEFCRMLDTVNLGPQQEYKTLRDLADRKLSIGLAVCGAAAAAEIERLQPEIVFLVPSFDMWRNGRLRSGELLRRCAALARAIPRELPIVLMAARGSLSVSQARKAGAAALLPA